jgi:hypothetical protein
MLLETALGSGLHNSHIIASGVGDVPWIFGFAEPGTAQDAELPAPVSFQLYVLKNYTKFDKLLI